MRILLINTNRERRPYPVIPIGLTYVAQALAEHEHHVQLLDLTFVREPSRAIAQAVQALRPQMIGLSIRNLDNSSYASPHSYLADMRSAAIACRQATGVPLVIGGPAVSIAPAMLLGYLGADVAVAGEGESAAPALASALAEGRWGWPIAGVLWAGALGGETGLLTGPGTPSGAAVPTPDGEPRRATEGDAPWGPRTPPLRPAAAECSSPPVLADLPRYVDVRRYLRAGAPLPVQTRRGCAFRCAYCTYPAIEGAAYRLKEPAQVAAEVDELGRRAGSRSFEFVDSTFNVPLPYALRVCEALARLPQRPHLQASGFTPAQSSDELLAAMRRAGFRTIVCSPDSAADPVLEAMGKGFQRQDLERLVESVHRAGMVALWSFLFGGLGETEETARDTLHFIAQRLGRSDLVFIAAGVRIYPGTPLEGLARSTGLLGQAEDLLAPRFYLSPQLPLQRLRALFAEYLAGARNCVYIADLQCRLVPWFERVMATLGVPPPMWRFAPQLRGLIPHRPRVLPEI